MPISSNVLQEQATSLLINHTLFYIFYYFSMTKCQYSLRTPASCICTIIRSHIYIHTLPIGIYMTHPYTIYLVVARSVMCETNLHLIDLSLQSTSNSFTNCFLLPNQTWKNQNKYFIELRWDFKVLL